MLKRTKKLLLSCFVSVLALSCVVPTYAIYEQELLAATCAGELDRVISYVTQGADVNAAALMSAAESGNLELVKYLVEHGADVANSLSSLFLCTY